ncbi:uncharacterized protein [Amphiura filiformis]|uniref:uncharacterized protein n=1 Tax=Amphiura filiformis TaxID=82378 RepID=UPI003B2220C5
MAESDPKRIMMWTLPRASSTVLLKCFSYIPQFQIINEPYNSAMTFGPEGFRKTGHVNGIKEYGDFLDSVKKEIEKNPGKYDHGWDDEKCTYDWVKNTLEGDWPGKKFVFCEDYIYPISTKKDKVPHGFTHTFFIRNPTSVFLANRIGTMENLPSEVAAKFDINDVPSWKIYPKYGYGELLDLIACLKDRDMVQSNPIVIDADDLLKHPESIMRKYCEATGIPYSDSMHTWPAGDPTPNWHISRGYLAANQIVGFYDPFFSSTGFPPPEDLPTPLPEDVVKLAARAEPYYQELYKMCIKP